MAFPSFASWSSKEACFLSRSSSRSLERAIGQPELSSCSPPTFRQTIYLDLMIMTYMSSRHCVQVQSSVSGIS